MDEKTPVKGLYREVQTKALINKDNTALQAYKKRKQASMIVHNLVKRVDELEAALLSVEERLRLLENK